MAVRRAEEVPAKLASGVDPAAERRLGKQQLRMKDESVEVIARVVRNILPELGARTRRSGPPQLGDLRVYPTVSLEDARALANHYIGQANRGSGPIGALERAGTTGGLTIEGLSKRFFADYVQMKELRAVAKYAGSITVHIVPRLDSILADLVCRQTFEISLFFA